MAWESGDPYDITDIDSHPMRFDEYLKLAEKPKIRIENEIFFHIDDNFFINADHRKSDLESSYIYIRDEYVQVVDSWQFVAIYTEGKNNSIKSIPETIDEPFNSKVEKCSQFVYIMLDKRNGYYKIGISKNPTYRESTLQSEKPDIVLMAYYNGIREDEKALHKKFASKRIRGEWFSLTSKDIDYINEYFQEN